MSKERCCNTCNHYVDFALCNNREDSMCENSYFDQFTDGDFCCDYYLPDDDDEVYKNE